jgi:hypothetical protein
MGEKVFARGTRGTRGMGKRFLAAEHAGNAEWGGEVFDLGMLGRTKTQNGLEKEF